VSPVRFCLLTLATATAAVGCTQDFPAFSGTTVESTIALPEESTTTTTIYVATGDPSADLGQLGETIGAVEVSAIANTACSADALLIVNGEARLYTFDKKNSVWTERAGAVPDIGVAGAIRVITDDFTGDDVYDFLVRFGVTFPVGGVLVHDAETCQWSWADIYDGTSTSKYIADLWSEEDGRLQASLYSELSETSYVGEMIYDRASRTFIPSTSAGY
jgi:hypothetical protein